MPLARPTQQETWGLERVVVASVAITARALAEVSPDLTLVQWRVLVVADRPEGVAVGEIAVAIGSKMAAASRLVGRLRARGLVATQRAESDGRLVLVRLTSDGSELRRRVVDRRRADLRSVLTAADLPDDTGAILDRLAAALEKLT